jgi:hypothetical protein
MLGPCHAYCLTCEADTTFMDMACKTCETIQDGLPAPRGIDKTDYAAEYARTPRPARPALARPNRGLKVSDGYVTGVEAFELKGSPVVKSLGERQRLREAQGLDPDTGRFRKYGDGGEKYN